jgi:hypothetical protein
MEIFVWCSPHTPTEVQKQQLLAGGISKIAYLKSLNSELFDKICQSADNERELSIAAFELIDWFKQNSLKWIVQPAGSQPFQVLLGMNLAIERQLGNSNIELVYSHSERVSVDKHNPDGSVTKVSEFNHVKFMSI